jgi:hypothetical protein
VAVKTGVIYSGCQDWFYLQWLSRLVLFTVAVKTGVVRLPVCWVGKD